MRSPNPIYRMTLERLPVPLVLANATIEDNPIEFVNNAFTALTGYAAHDALGRNCCFLEGPGTDPADTAALRAGIAEGREFTTEILNYKADGTAFRNAVTIVPLRDETGCTTHLIGLQRALGVDDAIAGAANIPERIEGMLHEVHHRVKNHLAMVVGMIRMQARLPHPDPRQNFAALAHRIETLQLLYQEMTDHAATPHVTEEVALGDYLARIAGTVATLDGRDNIRLDVAADDIRAPVDTAAKLGLLASELLTNAYRHAFPDGRRGTIRLHVERSLDGTIALAVADDGRGLAPGIAWPAAGNLGSRIVRSLVRGLGATLTAEASPVGAAFRITVPSPMPIPARPHARVHEAPAGAAPAN